MMTASSASKRIGSTKAAFEDKIEERDSSPQTSSLKLSRRGSTLSSKLDDNKSYPRKEEDASSVCSSQRVAALRQRFSTEQPQSQLITTKEKKSTQQSSHSRNKRFSASAAMSYGVPSSSSVCSTELRSNLRRALSSSGSLLNADEADDSSSVGKPPWLEKQKSPKRPSSNKNVVSLKDQLIRISAESNHDAEPSVATASLTSETASVSSSRKRYAIKRVVKHDGEKDGDKEGSLRSTTRSFMVRRSSNDDGSTRSARSILVKRRSSKKMMDGMEDHADACSVVSADAAAQLSPGKTRRRRSKSIPKKAGNNSTSPKSSSKRSVSTKEADTEDDSISKKSTEKKHVSSILKKQKSNSHVIGTKAKDDPKESAQSQRSRIEAAIASVEATLQAKRREKKEKKEHEKKKEELLAPEASDDRLTPELKKQLTRQRSKENLAHLATDSLEGKKAKKATGDDDRVTPELKRRLGKQLSKQNLEEMMPDHQDQTKTDNLQEKTLDNKGNTQDDTTVVSQSSRQSTLSGQSDKSDKSKKSPTKKRKPKIAVSKKEETKSNKAEANTSEDTFGFMASRRGLFKSKSGPLSPTKRINESSQLITPELQRRLSRRLLNSSLSDAESEDKDSSSPEELGTKDSAPAKRGISRSRSTSWINSTARKLEDGLTSLTPELQQQLSFRRIVSEASTAPDTSQHTNSVEPKSKQNASDGEHVNDLVTPELRERLLSRQNSINSMHSEGSLSSSGSSSSGPDGKSSPSVATKTKRKPKRVGLAGSQLDVLHETAESGDESDVPSSPPHSSNKPNQFDTSSHFADIKSKLKPTPLAPTKKFGRDFDMESEVKAFLLTRRPSNVPSTGAPEARSVYLEQKDSLRPSQKQSSSQEGTPSPPPPPAVQRVREARQKFSKNKEVPPFAKTQFGIPAGDGKKGEEFPQFPRPLPSVLRSPSIGGVSTEHPQSPTPTSRPSLLQHSPLKPSSPDSSKKNGSLSTAMVDRSYRSSTSTPNKMISGGLEPSSPIKTKPVSQRFETKPPVKTSKSRGHRSPKKSPRKVSSPLLENVRKVGRVSPFDLNVKKTEIKALGVQRRLSGDLSSSIPTIPKPISGKKLRVIDPLDGSSHVVNRVQKFETLCKRTSVTIDEGRKKKDKKKKADPGRRVVYELENIGPGQRVWRRRSFSGAVGPEIPTSAALQRRTSTSCLPTIRLRSEFVQTNEIILKLHQRMAAVRIQAIVRGKIQRLKQSKPFHGKPKLYMGRRAPVTRKGLSRRASTSFNLNTSLRPDFVRQHSTLKEIHQHREATKLQALVRGKMQRLRYRVMFLERKLNEIRVEKETEIAKIRAKTAKNIKKLERKREKQRQKEEKEQNELCEKAQLALKLSEHLKRENADIQDQNDKLQNVMDHLKKVNGQYEKRIALYNKNCVTLTMHIRKMENKKDRLKTKEQKLTTQIKQGKGNVLMSLHLSSWETKHANNFDRVSRAIMEKMEKRCDDPGLVEMLKQINSGTYTDPRTNEEEAYEEIEVTEATLGSGMDESVVEEEIEEEVIVQEEVVEEEANPVDDEDDDEAEDGFLLTLAIDDDDDASDISDVSALHDAFGQHDISAYIDEIEEDEELYEKSRALLEGRIVEDGTERRPSVAGTDVSSHTEGYDQHTMNAGNFDDDVSEYEEIVEDDEEDEMDGEESCQSSVWVARSILM